MTGEKTKTWCFCFFGRHEASSLVFARRMFIKFMSATRIVYHGASTPESEMEKIRYYVELPGDLYEDGYFMNLVKIAMGPLRSEEGRVPHHLLLRQNQTYLELQVVDSSEA